MVRRAIGVAVISWGLTNGAQMSGPIPNPHTIRLTLKETTTVPILNSSWMSLKSPVTTALENAAETTEIAQTAVNPGN